MSKKEISKSEKDIVIVGGRQECVVHEPKYVDKKEEEKEKKREGKRRREEKKRKKRKEKI